jgi:2-isopropylmalate synthase
MRIVVSELSGRNNIRMRAAHLGLDIDGNERVILQKIKELENNSSKVNDLKTELVIAIKEQNFERAIEIRDELKKIN